MAVFRCIASWTRWEINTVTPAPSRVFGRAYDLGASQILKTRKLHLVIRSYRILTG